MPLNTHNEPFSGGLVTARPAHMLQEGEFVALTNCGYRFDSHRLYPAESRLQTLTGISAYEYSTLGFAQFDDGVSYYITQIPSTLQIIEASAGSSLLAVSGYTTSNTLCVVPFRNQFLVLNGSNDNKIIYHTGGSLSAAPTAIQHGLDPVTTAIGVYVTTGTFPLGTSGLNQWYEYWYTELVTLADGTELESDTAVSAVTTTNVAITSLTQAVELKLPATLVNPAATKFRVYRNSGKVNQADVSFPIGIRIATIPVVVGSQTVFIDGTTTDTGHIQGVGTNSGATFPWINLSNLGSINAAYTSSTVTGLDGYATVSTAELRTTYTLTGLTNPISGIEIRPTCRLIRTGNVSSDSMGCWVSVDGGTTWGTAQTVPIQAGAAVTYILGGANNMLGLSLEASNIMVTLQLVVRFIGYAYGTGGASCEFDMDAVTLKIYYNGTSLGSNDTFPAVIFDINGDSASVGSNGKPTKASTGCILEDTLVTNDVANPSFIRWGMPGMLHAQPSVYFNDFETPRNDALTCLMSVGSRAAVGMETCLWRINYLPTENDATFARGQGRAFDEVDPSFGIVGPMAACTFVGAEGRLMLAFVSVDGLRVSDLFSTESACDDVNWRTMLTPTTALNKCVLINYPRNYTLRLYYPDGDPTYLVKYMDFLYHPIHLKNGKMKAVGPVTCGTAGNINGVTGAVCAPALHTGYSWSVVEGWGGSGTPSQKLWRRVDPGTSTATAQAPTITFRDMFLAGFGNEWKINDCWLVGGVGASTPITWVPSMTLRYTNQATVAGAGLNNVIATYNPTKFTFAKSANSITLSLTTATDVNDAAHGWDLMVIEGEGFGKEDD